METSKERILKAVNHIQLGLADGIDIEVISGLTAKDKIQVWNRPLEN